MKFPKDYMSDMLVSWSLYNCVYFMNLICKISLHDSMFPRISLMDLLQLWSGWIQASAVLVFPWSSLILIRYSDVPDEFKRHHHLDLRWFPPCCLDCLLCIQNTYVPFLYNKHDKRLSGWFFFFVFKDVFSIFFDLQFDIAIDKRHFVYYTVTTLFHSLFRFGTSQ
jgi:hypothetical protein